jgi:hypothetical protein
MRWLRSRPEDLDWWVRCVGGGGQKKPGGGGVISTMMLRPIERERERESVGGDGTETLNHAVTSEERGYSIGWVGVVLQGALVVRRRN